MGILSYKNKDFFMDDKKYRILSGAIHYFRVVPEYWEDRLKKLKACGFNTVETYTCWNLHEPKEGHFDFSGILDVEKFIKTANDLGLKVILRPGPYICAEWDFGGLPSWLLKYKEMRIRCYDVNFISKVRAYYKELFNRVGKYLSTNGGNVIAVQIENEYGSYGNDKKYLQAIVDIYKENNVDCLLFTSDGGTLFMLNGGTMENYLTTLNFGSEPEENFSVLDKFKKDQPLMCCEYWNGWFDHWYSEHNTRASGDTAEVFDRMLKMNASVNFYMFHGGTNFAFNNGANFQVTDGVGEYQPTITSYDYNCPISESGDMTPKYFAIKEVIEKHFGKVPKITVENLPKENYGAVVLDKKASLFKNIDEISTSVESSYTQTMEELNQNFGFILYSTVLKGPFEECEIEILGLHDRAIIYIDGEQKGIKERTNKRNDIIKIALDFNQEVKLDILVENLGRINYGPFMKDEKGIIGGVRVGNIFHSGWIISPIPLEKNDITNIKFEDNKINDQPIFMKGNFLVEECCDTFVRLDGFTKGNVFVNGFNIGRYWNTAGPQKTLYLPAPLLKKGNNEIIVFELEKAETDLILLTDVEDLG
ncbi:MAG: glycoside hydrolase family 35 protein [Lachnospirales bacterium]